MFRFLKELYRCWELHLKFLWIMKAASNRNPWAGAAINGLQQKMVNPGQVGIFTFDQNINIQQAQSMNEVLQWIKICRMKRTRATSESIILLWQCLRINAGEYS